MRNSEKKSATIYDITETAGFTAAIVSSVLNNKGYISKSTRDKFFVASKKLNYFLNPAARYLKKDSKDKPDNDFNTSYEQCILF